MLVCCNWASACVSPATSAETFRATRRSARSPWRARKTRPKAPGPARHRAGSPGSPIADLGQAGHRVGQPLGRMRIGAVQRSKELRSLRGRHAQIEVQAEPLRRSCRSPAGDPFDRSRPFPCRSAHHRQRRRHQTPWRGRPHVPGPPAAAASHGLRARSDGDIPPEWEPLPACCLSRNSSKAMA